jgi:hypothetical protein
MNPRHDIQNEPITVAMCEKSRGRCYARRSKVTVVVWTIVGPILG